MFFREHLSIVFVGLFLPPKVPGKKITRPFVLLQPRGSPVHLPFQELCRGKGWQPGGRQLLLQPGAQVLGIGVWVNYILSSNHSEFSGLTEKNS